jgi:hypothetical protein
MSGRLIVLVVILAGFGVLTSLALMDVGYFGILEPHFRSWGGAQVFVDLVVSCLLACIWMTYDAHERGLSAWPFVLITLVAGSFGPLLYLVVRELRSTARQPVSA